MPRAADEARLSRREAVRARAIFESAVDGMVTIDERGTVISINPAAVQIFGYAAEEVVGRNVKMLMPEPYRGAHDGYIANYLRTGDRRIIGIGREVEGRRKDGSVFPMDLAVSELRVDDSCWFLGTVRDITPRKSLEAQVHQAQKLEAIGRLAGGIAHDFNTLLGSIAGYAEILNEGLGAAPELQKAAQQVYRAAERGAALTRQLLAFSRRQVLRPKVVDLNAVVEDMDELLRRLVDARVELSADLAPRRLPVRVDSMQIEQVIMNLVINACDAMPDGGRLELSTRMGDTRSTCPDCRGTCVQLRVADTGVGMDEETKTKIFDPFFTTKETGKGTGLGLATVYGIVAQSQGQVRVESNRGEGSTFTICIPEATDEPLAEAPAAADAARGITGGHETILLVEDDIMFRELLAEVLETRGYRVWVAEDAAKALELCRHDETLPDLLVSDISMPGELSGSELAEELRRQDARLPVLLMSGYTDEVVPAGAASATAGASKFIQKPFSTSDFVATVRELLDAPVAKPT